ncbi:hypothetical protein PMAYCL1PPCAC_32331, partial [Pristionchus mayeri]
PSLCVRYLPSTIQCTIAAPHLFSRHSMPSEAEISIVNAWAAEMKEEMDKPRLPSDSDNVIAMLSLRTTVQAINCIQWGQVFRFSLIEQLRKEFGSSNYLDQNSLHRKLAFALCILMEDMNTKLIVSQPPLLPGESDLSDFPDTEVKLDEQALESVESAPAETLFYPETQPHEMSNMDQPEFAGSSEQVFEQDESAVKEEPLDDFDLTQTAQDGPPDLLKEEIKEEIVEEEELSGEPSTSHRSEVALQFSFTAARCRPFMSTAQLTGNKAVPKNAKFLQCITCEFRTMDSDMMRMHKTELECTECSMKLSACMREHHMERHERHRVNLKAAVRKRKATVEARKPPPSVLHPEATPAESSRNSAEKMAKSKGACFFCDFKPEIPPVETSRIREELDIHIATAHPLLTFHDAKQCLSCKFRTMFDTIFEKHLKKIFTCSLCNAKVIECEKKAHTKMHQRLEKTSARLASAKMAGDETTLTSEKSAKTTPSTTDSTMTSATTSKTTPSSAKRRKPSDVPSRESMKTTSLTKDSTATSSAN